MGEFTYTDASRQGSFLRMGIDGPAGSGKTYTALAVACAMAAATGGRVGMIDTERGSGRKYAPPFTFKHLNFTPPYHPDRLTRCLAESAEYGITHLVIDTWSRYWGGAGGMLQLVDEATARDGGRSNFNSGWKSMRPTEAAMIEAMLGYPGHLFVTLRVKTDYQVTNVGGQTKVAKLGLKPEQREGMEYEFDVVGDMDQDNNLVISKTRCPELNGGVYHQPGNDFAAILVDWLGTMTSTMTALDYRAAALDPAATFDSMRALLTKATDEQMLGAVVLDRADVPIRVEDLIKQVGFEKRAALKAASAPPAASAGQPAKSTAGTVNGQAAA